MQGDAEDTDGGDMPAVLDTLARMPSGTLVTLDGLCKILRRCSKSILRAVDMGELPRPVRLCGKRTWTAGHIIAHLEGRLDAEARKFAKFQRN